MNVPRALGVLSAVTVFALTGCTEKPIVDPTSAFPSPTAATPSATFNPLAPVVTLTRPLNPPDVTRARFLQVTDAGTGALDNGAMRAEDLTTVVRVPCASTAPASDTSLSARAGYGLAYRFSPARQTLDGSVGEIITRYASATAATAYVTAFEAAVAACPRQTDPPRVIDRAIVASDFVADDALLVSETVTGPDQRSGSGTFTYTTYRVVVRGGSTVIILQLAGWEGTAPVDPAHLQRLLQAALDRASA